MKIFLSHHLDPKTDVPAFLVRAKALLAAHGIQLLLPGRKKDLAKGKIRKADLVFGLEMVPSEKADWMQCELRAACRQEKPLLLLMEHVPEGAMWEGTWHMAPQLDRVGNLPPSWTRQYPQLRGIVHLLLGLVQLSGASALPQALSV